MADQDRIVATVCTLVKQLVVGRIKTIGASNFDDSASLHPDAIFVGFFAIPTAKNIFEFPTLITPIIKEHLFYPWQTVGSVIVRSRTSSRYELEVGMFVVGNKCRNLQDH